MINTQLKQQLIHYANLYETADFLNGDPSWFMHQVNGNDNQETIAFLASVLSYGNRKQFMSKIANIQHLSNNQPYNWITSGAYSTHFPTESPQSFYRLYSIGTMRQFFDAYRSLLLQHHSIGNHLRSLGIHDTLSAIDAICRHFSSHNVEVIVPKSTQSACKRICMFLRWMVRTDSPVDLGLWADFIDRRSLIIPLDTHVLQQAQRLGLSSGTTSSMSAARKLTSTLAEIFPDDPLKGDFALFGYGVNHKSTPNQ